MPQHKHIWISTLSLMLAFTCAASIAQAQDQPNPIGTWKWERSRNNQTSESILKIFTKEDKLAGTYKSSSRDAQEIKNVKLKKDILSFTYTVKFQDREFKINYKGKITGDTIKGTISFNQGDESREFEWTAKRFVEDKTPKDT